MPGLPGLQCSAAQWDTLAAHLLFSPAALAIANIAAIAAIIIAVVDMREAITSDW